MTDHANIPPLTGSPSLAPRIARAVEVGKLAAQRHQPAADAPQTASGATKDLSGTTVPTLELFDARVELHVDKDSGLVVGRVFDRQTNKEIRQIPSEAIVRLAAALKEQLGPLVNIKA